MKERSRLLAGIGISGIVGGLCCMTPIVMVLLGISTVSFATQLGDVLYWEYKWIFRIVGVITLGVALVLYFRSNGICTLNQAKTKHNRVIRTSLLVLASGVGAYTIWTYIVLHWWGKSIGLPW